MERPNHIHATDRRDSSWLGPAIQPGDLFLRAAAQDGYVSFERDGTLSLPCAAVPFFG